MSEKENIEELKRQFLASLTEDEQAVFAIAQQDLAQTLRVEKCTAFIAWRKKRLEG